MSEYRIDGRVAEGARLLSVYTEMYRGFESLSVHIIKYHFSENQIIKYFHFLIPQLVLNINRVNINF